MDYKKNVENFSTIIEPEIDILWEILIKFKNIGKENGNLPTSEEAWNYQYRLTTVLFKISQQYVIVSRAIKSNKKRQRTTNHKQWKSTNNELNDLVSYLNFLMVIVRSFGDSFVYMFYGNDREYLNKHLEAPPQSLLIPQKIGGLGEMEFVRKFKVLGGEFVIYHGITNILRIGDASLFNLQSQTTTVVVELKTGKINDRSLFLRATIIGHTSRNKEFQKRTKVIKPTNTYSDFKLNPEAQKRFERQVKGMYESFKFLDEKPNQDNRNTKLIYTSSKFEILKKLALNGSSDTCNYEQLNKSMIIGGFRYSGKTIFQRLIAKYPEQLINGSMLQNLITSILKSSFSNELIFGQFHFNRDMKITPMIGTKPVFWEPIDPDTLKKIYFGEIVYFTIYNVGWFLQAMNERGFKYEYSEEHKMTGFVRDDEGKKSFIAGTKYFLKLITDHLQDESAVLEAIDLCYAEMKEGKKTGYANMEIYLQ